MPCYLCQCWIDYSADEVWTRRGRYWYRYHRACHHVDRLNRAVQCLNYYLSSSSSVATPAVEEQFEQDYLTTASNLDVLATSVERLVGQVLDAREPMHHGHNPYGADLRVRMPEARPN